MHQSRTEKVKGISTAEVRERQLAQLSLDEQQSLQKLYSTVQPVRPVRAFEPENLVLNHAVAHVFERKSVVPEHELLNIALSHRPGEVDLPALKSAVKCSPDLVKPGNVDLPRVRFWQRWNWILIQTVNARMTTRSRKCIPATGLGRLARQRSSAGHLSCAAHHDRITGLRRSGGHGQNHSSARAGRRLQKRLALEPSWPIAQRRRQQPKVCAPKVRRPMTLQSCLLTKPALSVRQLVVLDETGAVRMDDMKRLF